MQEKYWDYMVEVKAWIYYLDIYAEESYKWDRKINIYGAIASSSSIAAWAIWNELSYIWALIIAISQVLTVVKEYIPFSRRLKLLRPFIADMQLVYVKIEYDWYKVAEGQLTNDKINEILFSYKKEVEDIVNKYLQEEILIEKDEYIKEADQKTKKYFESNF